MKISRHCQRRRLEPLFESRERVVQVSSTEKRIDFRLKTDGLHATCRHSRQTASAPLSRRGTAGSLRLCAGVPACGDRKSTRLNSSHRCISYAVFCLKKKKKKKNIE